MASPFQRYQGEQVQSLAPGYLQTIQAGYQDIGRGLASLGEGVAKGIEKYQKNKLESEAADEKLAGAIQHFGQMAEAYKGHPEFDQLSGIYGKAAEDASSALNGNLGKKLGALSRLELIDKNAGSFIAATTAKHQAMAAAAYSETPEEKRVMSNEILMQHGYRPGDEASLNRAIGYAVRKMQEANNQSGLKPGDAGYNDVQTGIANLLGNAKAGIADALKADPSNLQLASAERELSGAIKQFQAAFGATEALQAAGSADISKFGQMAVEGQAERQAAVAAMQPGTAPGSAVPASQNPAIQEIAKKEAEQQLKTETTQAQNSIAFLENLRNKLSSNERISAAELDVTNFAGRLAGAALDGGKSILDSVSPVIGGLGRAASSMLPKTEEPRRLLKQQEKIYEKAGISQGIIGMFADLRSGKVMSANQRIKAIEEIDRQLAVLRKQQAAPDTKEARAAQITAQASPQPAPKTLNITATGNVARDIPLSAEERVSLAREAMAKSEYVRTRFGGKVPLSAIQALQSKIVQAPPMVTDPVTGARLFQNAEGKWQQVNTSGRGVGSGVGMSRPLFRPDHESIRTGRQQQYVLEGNYTGKEGDEDAFIKTTQKRARALTSIERLLEINEKTAESLRPGLVGEARTIVNEIISSNRVDLIGPGQVAVAEWQMLEKLVSDPTKLVELDEVTRSNLRRLMQRMADVMDDEAYASGLRVVPVQSAEQIGAQGRMQNLLNR